MWQLAIPLVLLACEGDGILLVIAGVVALVLMQQRRTVPRVYGPETYASARVAVNETEGTVGRVEETTGDGSTERVSNPRKMSTDLDVQTTEAETTRIPETHIVGFRGRPSRDSRTRLLTRQREEMKQYSRHQYE